MITTEFLCPNCKKWSPVGKSIPVCCNYCGYVHHSLSIDLALQKFYSLLGKIDLGKEDIEEISKRVKEHYKNKEQKEHHLSSITKQFLNDDAYTLVRLEKDLQKAGFKNADRKAKK